MVAEKLQKKQPAAKKFNFNSFFLILVLFIYLFVYFLLIYLFVYLFVFLVI